MTVLPKQCNSLESTKYEIIFALYPRTLKYRYIVTDILIMGFCENVSVLFLSRFFTRDRKFN
jgi:hypothetical protein